MTWQRGTLWGLWGLTLTLALVCGGLFAQGVFRDVRAEDPVLRIDFSAATGWVEVPFRVWGRGTYDLLLASVNHDRLLVGRLLGAEFEVQVTDPEGRPAVGQIFGPGSTGLQIPDNYGDVRLATVELHGSAWRSWTLRARVLRPDPAFRAPQTELKLYKRRYDPGMGGMMNYVMIIPGGILLLVALALAVPLARGGSRFPLIVTVSVSLLLFFLPYVIGR